MADFKANAVFGEIKQRLAKDPGLAKKVNAIFCFKISAGPGGKSAAWIVDLKSASPAVKEGEGKADCTIKMKDDDFLKMMTGQLDAQQAFFKGKLKLSGNIGLATKLKALQQSAPKSKL